MRLTPRPAKRGKEMQKTYEAPHVAEQGLVKSSIRVPLQIERALQTLGLTIQGTL